MNNSNLEFRKIKSLNFLYEINENGTIFRNVKSKKQLKIVLDMHHSAIGYYKTMVHHRSVNSGKSKRVMIHRVVAECWLGECPEGYEVDHIDRNPHNNNYKNLRYVTKSEQMKNRNHTYISQVGAKNLEKARLLRAKPVRISYNGDNQNFNSYAECSRYLSKIYNIDAEKIRYRLRVHRKKIYDYSIEYFLNAETKHGCSTEQEIVHNSDITGNYKTAFNAGKQDEVSYRVDHVNQMEK